ncbi:MAG: nucleoside triphosphate pyrophosphatase [Candidatus Pacearchaeota archaeon]
MLVLKSASPRRKEILEKLGLKLQISPSYIDESQAKNEDFFSYLRRVTVAKLEIPKISEHNNVYVASDTIVVLNEKIFPKPSSLEECFSFLKELSSKIHSVFSSLAIYKKSQVIYDFDETRVQMKNWSEKEIWEYIKTANPLDKAGGYGIQDTNSPVESFKGSFTNVLGFPIQKFFQYSEVWQEHLYN